MACTEGGTWRLALTLFAAPLLARAEIPPAQVFIDNGELAYIGELSHEANQNIGVQQRITTLGQQGEGDGEHGKAIGWTYSQADFARLGVGHIMVINGPWQLRFLHSAATVDIIAVP